MAWHGYWTGAGAGFWWIFPVIWLLVASALVGFAIWAVRRLGGRAQDNPLEILKRRLASGEISQDDYDRTRKVLQG